MKQSLLIAGVIVGFICSLPSITSGVARVELSSVVALKPFVKGSMEKIKAQRKGRPFILILWSIDCPACYEELTMWRRVKARYPALDVLLISTDASALKKDVLRVVNKMGVGGLELWQFADAFSDRLRYEIEPGWSGELPRTYFYSATGEYVGRSGVIKQDKVEAWIE